MSRSYRKPYASVTGSRSAKQDKVLAHRGVRRVHNRIVRMMLRDPGLNILLPHFRECPWNNVYSWTRDGSQRLRVPDAAAWSRHMLAVQGFGYPYTDIYYLDWPPKWSIELMRK
jgi:hypothetical protein